MKDACDEEEIPLSWSGSVIVRPTPYTNEAVSRGVFATVAIPRNTLVERSHCLRFTAREHEHAMQTVLQHYTFCAGGGEYYLALGLGSLFNHSDPPNVEFRIRRPSQTILFYTCRDVDAGDELCIFYGRNLWFAEGSATHNAAEPSCVPRRVSTAAVDEEDDPLPFGQ